MRHSATPDPAAPEECGLGRLVHLDLAWGLACPYPAMQPIGFSLTRERACDSLAIVEIARGMPSRFFTAPPASGVFYFRPILFLTTTPFAVCSLTRMATVTKC